MKTKYFILLFVGFALLTGVMVYAIDTTNRAITLEKERVNALTSYGIVSPSVDNIVCSDTNCWTKVVQTKKFIREVCRLNCTRAICKGTICKNVTEIKTIMDADIVISKNSTMSDTDIDNEITLAIKKKLVEVADSLIAQRTTINKGGGGNVTITALR